MPCRIQRRDAWTLRIELEARQYPFNVFVTLTYSKFFKPDNGVSKRALQLYFKRLRKSLGFPMRYFAVGEYGEKKGRPHYHFIGFGLDLPDEQKIKHAWTYLFKNEKNSIRLPIGIVDVKPMLPGAAAYLASYTVKMLTTGKKVTMLDSVNPEFALMSRKPALGTSLANELAYKLEASGLKMLDSDWQPIFGNIPNKIRHNGRVLPIDATMKKKIMKALWAGELTFGKKVAQDMKVKMELIKMLSDPVSRDKYYSDMEESEKRSKKIERLRLKKVKL